jgi:ABC-type sugar transport system ATPase subunit
MAERSTIPTLQTPLVSLRGVTKNFGGIRALEDFSFDICAGDVVGLVGDNGAGKSTLIKILSGVHEPTRGEIELEGRAFTIARPVEAHRLGVETVYQDLSLISAFTAAENVFLGRELS